MALRLMTVVGIGAIVAASAVSARQAELTEKEAASMERKLVAIVERGEAAAKNARPLRTSFTDREVNAYFKFNGELMPDGVTSPRVTIDDGGKLQARAIVNLAEALKTKERSWADPLAWVGGQVEIAAIGTVRGENGKGTLALEKATFGGVPVPISLLQQVVSYYSQTPESPAGFNLSEPFNLPSRIRAVETRRGQATIVQ